MKKVLTMALMAALALSSTSCLNSDSEDNETKAQVYMYNIVKDMHDDSAPVAITQSYTNFLFNYTKSTLTADVQTMLPGGLSGRFNTGELKMTAGTRGFSFSTSGASGSGLVIENFDGLFDPNMGVIKYNYQINGDYYISSVSGFNYNFTRFVATNIETGVTELDNESETGFSVQPDLTKKTLTLTFNNLYLAGTQSRIQKVDYSDIPYTLDAVGIDAYVKDEVKSKQGYNDCIIKNLSINLYDLGLKTEISFDLNKHHYTATGYLFYNKF